MAYNQSTQVAVSKLALFDRRGEFHRGVARDIRHVAEIAYCGDPSVDQRDFDEVAGAWVTRIAEHGNDLARIQPRRDQVPIVDGGVVGNVVADLLAPCALHARD